MTWCKLLSLVAACAGRVLDQIHHEMRILSTLVCYITIIRVLFVSIHNLTGFGVIDIPQGTD